jgi:toxin ParE1/3/4
MRKMRLIFSEDFYIDLQNIIEYIKLDSPRSARSFANKIMEKIKLLKKNPEMGKESDDPRLAGTRLLIIGNYLVLYEIKAEDNVVYLHRFFHGARDYPNLFLSMK